MAFAHHQATVDDHGFHVGRFGGVNQVGIDVVERYLVKRVAIDEDYIRSLAFFDRADLFLHMKRTGTANRG